MSHPSFLDTLFREPIVGVGLARWDQKQLGFPGWYERSIGFHSDDALVYDSQEGGAYTTTKLCDGPLPIGDTLGCGLDPDSGHIFFTRNGQTLNEPARELISISLGGGGEEKRKESPTFLADEILLSWGLPFSGEGGMQNSLVVAASATMSCV